MDLILLSVAYWFKAKMDLHTNSPISSAETLDKLLNLLCLSFCICKMGIVIVPIS